MNKKGTNKLTCTIASMHNKNSTTEIFPISTTCLTPFDVCIFLCLLFVGLVPPILVFHAVLSLYGLLLRQLHPDALLTLTIF
jgi:hypothetical protein